MALPFLPSENIRNAFEDVIQHYLDSNSHDQLINFVNYYRSQWIENDSFPPSSWSVYKETIRTNNDVEGKSIKSDNSFFDTYIFFILSPLLFIFVFNRIFSFLLYFYCIIKLLLHEIIASLNYCVSILKFKFIDF